jgi:hypothetical protein
VPRIVENLGGSKLYGDDPTVALRELIQNGADAVQARRRLEERPSSWGTIVVALEERDGSHWLIVEDNGIGMSEMVLTGPLLDFGTSFWRSPLAMEEFPGLMAAGMQAIGRFGIGFFSTFMLGSEVKVYSRRADRAREDGRLLEFNGGTSMRPILAPANPKLLPIDGGTRVEVRLKKDPESRGGLLHPGIYGGQIAIERLVAALAPSLSVEIKVLSGRKTVAVSSPGDWIELTEAEIVGRLNPRRKLEDNKANRQEFIRPMMDASGEIVGRAFIEPDPYYWEAGGGWVTVSGLRANRLRNVQGILLGDADTASRDIATPLVAPVALATWATEQARLVADHILNEEKQAKIAEIVLECGGDIGNLKIIKCGVDWLSKQEFVERLQSISRLAIAFDGEFSFEEDKDDIHPKEFRMNFIQADNAAYTLKFDGAILKGNGGAWPKNDRADNWSDSNVATLIRSLIAKVWDNGVHQEQQESVVGTVNSEEICRIIHIFQQTGDEADKNIDE